MITIRHRGKYRMRNGVIAEVWGKDHDPHPYPWVGKIEGQPDDDGWNSYGHNWKSHDLDLVEHITS